MSHLLWKYYWENDVERFRRLLAPAGHMSQSPGVGSLGNHSGETPGAASASFRGALRPRKTSAYTSSGKSKDGNTAIGRNEINARDHAGLTILLRAASSTSTNAHAFIQALIDHPAIDLYAQDAESGWNALHRSLYAGNVSIARMLLEKEREYLGSLTVSNVSKAGLLIKTKDNEGKSPFDLYNSTVAQRPINVVLDDADLAWDSLDHVKHVPIRRPEFSSAIRLETEGDELYVFGSNKNLSLGVGDEDDRQFPERIHLKRPESLIQRFHEEYLEQRGSAVSGGLTNIHNVPALVRNRPLIMQDIIMSKLHSAILTTDPVSNLYVCGVGRGGRLGLGDENTQFRFIPVQGPLADRRVHQVALGQNHTLAVAGNGELWTWGLNTDSQLGFVLPSPSKADEELMCVTPRQVFGPLKKELVIGVAASAIHSVAHTGSSLFCWGRNAGQLALMDADSRSLDIQQVPRKVAASLLSAPILMVSAIDKATSCLLSNHTVWVFTNYGYNQVKFPVPDAFANYNIEASFSSRYDAHRRKIGYITSGGDTIAALTTAGDLFTMHVSFSNEASQSAGSTTNPVKIRGALTRPQCIWDSRKDGVASVNVGEHGSVIICTESGAVWNRVKRSKSSLFNLGSARSGAKRKDFKFERVPYITNCVTARSSTFGAFAAIRQSSKVMTEQMNVAAKSIWDDVGSLMSLEAFDLDVHTGGSPRLAMRCVGDLPRSAAARLLQCADIVAALTRWLEMNPSLYEDRDMTVCTSCTPNIKIPVHAWVFAARSSTLRITLSLFRKTGHNANPDIIDLKMIDSKVEVTFIDTDIYTLLNLVVYAYQDDILPLWRSPPGSPSQASYYRQVRNEVMKLATKLHLLPLEKATRLQTYLERSLDSDFQEAITDPCFFEDGDVVLDLNGKGVVMHSQLLCQRCPFFQGMFLGRSKGSWLSQRRGLLSAEERMTVDLSHMNPTAFDYVFNYLYADAGIEMFDDVVASSMDEFSELVLDVLNIANELMLDRLSQICQSLIGRFVTARNIAVLLNEISPCAVTDFKVTGLEYICLQLESMLENHLLDNLDEDLIYELDEVVRGNQLAKLPFAKSGRAEQLLHELDPRLLEDIEEERRIRLREMAYKASQREDNKKQASSHKTKIGSLDEVANLSPTAGKARRKSRIGYNEPLSPVFRPRTSQTDLIFDMDDEDPLKVGASTPPKINARAEASGAEHEPMPKLPREWFRAKGRALGTSHASPLGSPDGSIAASPQPLMPTSSDRPSTQGTSTQSRRPWASAMLPTAKLDLKDILAEASSNSSALSAGLAAQSAKQSPSAPSGTSKSQPKMSQKERKRKMQRHAEAEAAEQASKGKQAPWEETTPSSNPAPWKTNPQRATKTSHTDAVQSQIASQRAAKAGVNTLVTSDTSADSSKTRTASPDTRFPGQSRTISSPAVPSASDTRKQRQQIIPHSKSYVTAAPKSEAIIGVSMAYIIAQERRQQELIKEAVAKRSLQDIQQEQEFQNWWDQESRRVQEEEEARRTAKGRNKGNNVNPRGRRGKGGGTKAQNGKEMQLPREGEASTAATPRGNDALSRGRGNRGRGRKTQT